MCGSRKPGGGRGREPPGSTWLARGRPRVGAHLAGSVPGVDPHTLTAPGGAALTSFVGDWCLCTVLVSVDRRTAHAVSRCVSLHRAQGYAKGYAWRAAAPPRRRLTTYEARSCGQAQPQDRRAVCEAGVLQPSP